MLTHTYTDAFLAKHITEALEARAAADVADLGTLPAAWVARLVVTRAYILVALEKSSNPENDPYAAKYTAYRKEWADQLTQARAAQAAAQAASGAGAGATGIWSVNLERC